MSMNHHTSPTCTRRKPDVAYSRLVEIATESGITLLAPEWHGLKSYYDFRCASGNNFTRIGTVAMRGTIACLECEQVRTAALSGATEREQGSVELAI